MGWVSTPLAAGYMGGPTLSLESMAAMVLDDAQGRALCRAELGLTPEPAPSWWRRMFGKKPAPPLPGVLPVAIMVKLVLSHPEYREQVKGKLETMTVERRWWQRH